MDFVLCEYVRERECVSVWKVSFYQLFIFLKPFIKHSNDMYQFITVCLYCFCLLNPGVFQVFHYSQVFVSLCIWIIQTSTRVHARTHTHYADYGGVGDVQWYLIIIVLLLGSLHGFTKLMRGISLAVL